jgi:polar amino acid transport system substrate-binding protein
LAAWYNEGIANLKMSVNLSAGQFQTEGLAKLVKRIITETGIRAVWLELEITESVAMKNLDYTVSVLRQFREMGVGISLDDFGTGYSSLNYLMQLPINNLKIDKAFIHGITNNTTQAKIAKTLISLAHSINLSVTAEGVDNTSQLEFLISEKCDTVQGYLFSEPKPACELDLAKVEIIRKVPISG